MLTSIEWLSVLKSKICAQSDYAVSKILGVSTGTVSSYRTRKTFLDQNICNLVAELIEIDAKYLYISTHYERSHSKEEKEVWLRLWEDVGGAQLEENIRKNLDVKWLQPAVRFVRTYA
ncbi:hypothetical protein [uncultured Aquitalea sp.]|uniref:hypothetical protein n=1 Tax=uncultured Aquitalea sp. TaxID=540272 RepID=UPI0025FC6653|nr:hypothetical protein [uncultured Aquitalea sp.]